MVDEMMIFKKMSVLLTEKDFVDAIVSVSLKDLTRSLFVRFEAKACPKFDLIHKTSVETVRCVGKTFMHMLSKCKRLKVDALGYMFTIAMRCAPSLAYLEKFRQYMAQANEKNLEDETAATLTNKKHVALLAEEDCTVLCTPRFEFQNVADFVLPETLRWLDELELQASFKLQANQLDSAKLARTRKKHHMVQ
ncbi:unnamed protein product [Arabidopsis thaliana]|uniref:(thale cress) hypothetical protein n=1 Tax=Arabidopsis thaliana TaxID=3702 RepID=A0A7G2EH60_ARATH|nr:unnamed protein product [Arabidopsis thaliana]